MYMLEDINSSYNKLTTFFGNIPNIESMGIDDIINYISNSQLFHETFGYLKKYTGNIEFIKKLNLTKNQGDYLLCLKYIFGNDFYYKICDYYKDTINLKYDFLITELSDVDFLKKIGYETKDILKFGFTQKAEDDFLKKIRQENNGLLDIDMMLIFLEERSRIYNIENGKEVAEIEKKKYVDIIIGSIMQDDYRLVQYFINNKDNTKYFYNKLVDLDFKNIDELAKYHKLLLIDDEELAEKIAKKYGTNALPLIKNITNNILNFIPNITFEEYIKYKNSIDNESLLLKFLNQGHKEAIFYSNIFSDKIISHIVNELDDDNFKKIIEKKQELLGFLKVQKRLVSSGNYNYIGRINDIYQNIESFDFICNIINSVNEEYYLNSCIKAGLMPLVLLVKHIDNNNNKFKLPMGFISTEVIEKLIELGYSIDDYLKDQTISENVTEFFLKKGKYKALMKANKLQIEQHIDLFLNNDFISFLENNTKYLLSEDLLKYILLNGKEKILKEYLNSSVYNDSDLLIVFNEDEIQKIKQLVNTNKEVVNKIFNKMSLKNQLELVKINPRLIYEYKGISIKAFEVSGVFSKEIPWDAIDFYHGNKGEFIYNFDKYKDFIEKNGFQMEKVIQYALANSYDWISGINNIINSDKIDEFLKFKDYMFSKEKDLSEVYSIERLVLIIKNYERYPELCNDITNINIELSTEEQLRLNYIFNRKGTFKGQYSLTCLDDCSKINDFLKEKYRISMEENDIDKMKNFLCNVLFNYNYSDIEGILELYGDTTQFKKLLFNDKNNPKIGLYVQEMIFYTQMMEEIIYCDDFELLKEIASNINENLDLAIKCSMLFSNYHQQMRKFFELESKQMLTNISKIKQKESLLDREMSEKCGVDVLDFSDKKYILYAHVLSNKENVSELVSGIPKQGHNFICLSPISDRNQEFYWQGNNVIFLYDSLPNNSFIMSSLKNIGSNGIIKENSTEVTNVYRIQRGILETSSAPFNVNSEVLCFRVGLKPIGIALPGGRLPTNEELEIAKKHNLKLIKTQEKESSIRNPKKIEMNDNYDEKKDYLLSEKIKNLTNLRNKLIPQTEKKLRKIAVLSDSHGLFEPTLAILEDARKNGITEIYSLGDNIGTGPSPGEVIDLLESYGVKSVMGNHELYTLEGVESFIEHFNRTGGYTEAKRNSEWTRSQLSTEQKMKIKLYPQFIDLVVGGEKLHLCHYTRNFNSNELNVNANDYDKILQGHIHFEFSDKNVVTLRGAGIGGSNATASYIILQEKKDGGFDIIKKEIPYDQLNLHYTITESSLDDSDANKISSWSHVGKR